MIAKITVGTSDHSHVILCTWDLEDNDWAISPMDIPDGVDLLVWDFEVLIAKYTFLEAGFQVLADEE